MSMIFKVKYNTHPEDVGFTDSVLKTITVQKPSGFSSVSSDLCSYTFSIAFGWDSALFRNFTMFLVITHDYYEFRSF